MRITKKSEKSTEKKKSFKVGGLLKVVITVAVTFSLALTLNYIDDVFVDHHGEHLGETVVMDIIVGAQKNDTVKVEIVASVLDTITLIDTVYAEPVLLPDSVHTDAPADSSVGDKWFRIPGTKVIIAPRR